MKILLKILELINKFNKLAEHTINIHKLVIYIFIYIYTHTNNELSEKETRKTIPFTRAPKRIKYLGKLTKDKMFNFSKVGRLTGKDKM